jgi:hypothetical protein
MISPVSAVDADRPSPSHFRISKFISSWGNLKMAFLLTVFVTALLVVNLTELIPYIGGGRPTIWLTTVALFAFTFFGVGMMLKDRPSGVFIDERNKISLSRIQLVLWSVLLISALVTAGLGNVLAGAPSPLAISIPGQVWALLGLGSFTAVAAPAILQRKEKDAEPTRLDEIKTNLRMADTLRGAVTATGAVVKKATPKDARWMDIVRGDTDNADYVDVSKLQQLSFTILLITVYGAGIFALFQSSGPITKFPDVDQGFLALLGISHAAYLANKAN